MKAEEFVKQRDKDGIAKYWIGVDGENYRMDLRDVIRAMEDFAEQERAIERRKAITEAIDVLDRKVQFGYLETAWKYTKAKLESLKPSSSESEKTETF